MLKKISIGVAVVASFINILLWGYYSGFLSGAVGMCNIQYPVIGNLALYHFDPYFNLVIWQRNLTFILLVYIAGKLIEGKIWLRSLCLLPLIASGIFHFLIWETKSSVIQDENPYINVIRESVWCDWLNVALTIVLLILQFSTILSLFQQKTKATLK